MTDDPITAATLKCKSAKGDTCRLYWARQVIALREHKGEFYLVQGFDDVMRETLARVLIQQLEKP